MSLVQSLPEMDSLLQWLGKPPRHPAQINRINEADCEIVQMSSGSFLVSTIDSVADEISFGLYQDPYTMGWVAAQASLSDLAAVGSQPLGLLFSAQWGPEVTLEYKQKVNQGFQDALRSAGTFLLGGDHGTSAATVLTSVGIGISEKPPTQRIGMQPGDYLCLSGSVGAGPALAFQLLRGEKARPDGFLESWYRPQARVQLGQKLAGVATSMMDTSDGVLSALQTLKTLNQVGLELIWNPETLDLRSVAYCQSREIPLWMLWLGEHGDFELLVTIPSEKIQTVLSHHPDLRVIGRVVPDPTVTRVHFGMKNGIYEERDFEIAPCINSGYPLDALSLSKRFSEWVARFKKDGFP